MPITQGQLPEQPQALWQHFYQLSQIPRPSKHEQAALQYIQDHAEQKNYQWRQDQFGNLVIYINGKGKGKNSPALAIQNHIDMVAVAETGQDFDFKTQALNLKIDNEWLQADGTTLGADNGIGCAAALALLDQAPADHPPLELLFTTEEEIGLIGATQLDSSLLSAKRLLNLDSEEWGSAYIGCAGGLEYQIQNTYACSDISSLCYQIQIQGFKGGHSGIDIDKPRRNASLFLLELLDKLQLNWQWLSFQGGQANNVIPRAAQAQIAIKACDSDKLKSQINSQFQQLKAQLDAIEQSASLSLELIANSAPALNHSDSQNLLKQLRQLPNGVHSHQQIEADLNVVSCSNNIGLISLDQGQLAINLLFRYMQDSDKSSIDEYCQNINQSIFNCRAIGHYPNWPISADSQLKQQLEDSYQHSFNACLSWKTIHAGLECGLLVAKIPDLDIISFGPSIENAHSPGERVNLASVAQFWQLLNSLLAHIANSDTL